MPIPAHVNDRKLDRASTKRALTADRDNPLAATDAELDTALATVNQDALYDAERAPWTAQVWDRTSPINGVPAQHFLDRDDVGDTGDIYLLLRDGQVVGFQPHDPGQPGHVRINKGAGKARGEKHADTIAADSAAAEVVRKVREHIAAKRANTP